MEGRKRKFAKRTEIPEDLIDRIFREVDEYNTEREKKGLPSIISLCVGQPHLGTHPHILKEAGYFLDSPDAIHAFPYSPLQGCPDTLDAICRLYKDYYPTVDYSSKEVMISNGATQAIHNALGALIDKRDVVVVVEPYYSAYSSIIHEMGGELVKISTANNHFRLSAASLEKTLSANPEAKVLILNYPNNPSGVDLTKDELAEIADILKKYPDLTIIIDDVYRDLTKTTHFTLLDVDPRLKHRCIMINSASKGFALPGARIGMVGADAEMIEMMTKQQAKAVSCMSRLSEEVLIAAAIVKLNPLHQFQEWLDEYNETYSKNRSMISDCLESFGGNIVPGDNGLFVLANFESIINQPIPDTIKFTSPSGEKIGISQLHQKIGSRIKNDVDLVEYLMQVAGVALIPGSAFGIDESKGYLRFSCAKHSEELEEALILIKRSLEAIPGFSLQKKCKTSNPMAVSQRGLFASIEIKTQSSGNFELPEKTIMKRY